MPKISCVILSCDPHLEKGNSLYHCILLLMMQDFLDFEVIIVNNGTEDPDLNHILTYTDELNEKYGKDILVRIYNLNNPKNRGAARNFGASKARGECVVFIDDDTLLLSGDALTRIAEQFENADYGYGARRLWTEGALFQERATDILKDLRNGKDASLKQVISEPLSGVRGEESVNLQKKTFIGNFGFCRIDVFRAVGGFPEYEGYGFEDDCVMFRLFEGGYRFSFLDKISVLHVNHPVHGMDKKTLIPYFTELLSKGYYWFHVAHTFRDPLPDPKKVLESLQTLHHDFRLEKAYQDYQKLLPLNIDAGTVDAQVWQSKNQYSIERFARLISSLQQSTSLDQWVCSSGGDFDNLAPVLQVAIGNAFVSIEKNGSVTPRLQFRFTQKKSETHRLKIENVHAREELNQFPCDTASRQRRLEFLKERYPYAEYLRFGVIGDDDLLSVECQDEYWAWPVVVECDEQVISKIASQEKPVQIYKKDVRDFESTFVPTDNEKVHTFITDPPYTLHGALAFIRCGLLFLHTDVREKEFYVILNETMMGADLQNLLRICNDAGITLYDVRTNFSQYILPAHYSEKARAENFLNEHQLPQQSLHYSSSSNLYIFKTQTPNLVIFDRALNGDLLYEHYADTKI